MALQRSLTDRRSGYDRREKYDLAVISELGLEQRRNERRKLPEQRYDWVRITKWSSSCVSP